MQTFGESEVTYCLKRVDYCLPLLPPPHFRSLKDFGSVGGEWSEPNSAVEA